MNREFCVFYPAIWNLYIKLLLLALSYPTLLKPKKLTNLLKDNGASSQLFVNAILRGFKMYIIPCKCKKEKNRKRLYGKIYILSFAKQRKKLQIVLRDQWASWYPAMFHVSQWNMHKLNYSLALETIDHMSLGLLLVLILAPEKN